MSIDFKTRVIVHMMNRTFDLVCYGRDDLTTSEIVERVRMRGLVDDVDDVCLSVSRAAPIERCEGRMTSTTKRKKFLTEENHAAEEAFEKSIGENGPVKRFRRTKISGGSD